MAHRAPSSSITSKWTYDVFLSFYGEDTRLGFTGHLHQALRDRGIHVFLDDECIRTGENITPTLFRAIEESRIAIIVLSRHFANSTFCLRELVKILECFKEESRLIFPVFYHVDPSELRNQKKSYAKALARLEKRFKDESHLVEKWRRALSQAADLKGYHLKSKIDSEQECITRIAEEVVTRINQKPFHVTNYPVGLVPRVKEVISYLDLWSTEKIKMIGIWGAGGIGKSTIARALYNSIADNFEGLCFLSDVRKRSKESNGLSHLQETLLSKLVMAKDLNFGDYHEGIPIIQCRLSQKKILLILDDVDESDQLKALAGSCNWFGCGSRIIITTRDKQLLKIHGIESIYDVKLLNSVESLKLLSWYAFKKENVDSNYVEVGNGAVDYSCGFPLALEVIGSNLRGKGVNHWSSALDQFKRRPQRTIWDTLKLSYDMLEEEPQQVFLDLACFFNGEKLANIIHIVLCVRAIEPTYAIDTLIDKSLIKIEQDRVTMHDLIEDVGKGIVQQESPNEPGEQSRLWFYQDILHVLQQDTGTKKVGAIILDLPKSIEVQWSGEELMKMKNLKMLVIRNACFSESPKYLPNNLRWLEWKGYSFKSLPHQVLPTQLAHLDLSYSSCEFLQPFDKKFLNLSHMNLSFCKFLQQIPDLSVAFNLTELWLDYCTNLTEIHDSVGCLNKLKKLSAMRCKNLKIFPSRFKLPSLEHLNLVGCSSLQTFPEISVVMKEMQILNLDETAIAELPSSICNLIGLRKLSVRNCANLKQLPSNICTLPNLCKLTTDSCQGLSHFKMREGGDEASLYCSAMSSKMEHLCFSNCNLSDDSLAFCFSHFTNMIYLDLSFNHFTILPECIKECHKLEYLLLDHCIQLEHIRGMPPNLNKFSAICCTALTESSKRKVFNKASNIQPGKRKFIWPEKELPKGLHCYNQGSSVSFWVRNVFPIVSLWILFKDHRHHVYNYFSVRINGTNVVNISSNWVFPSSIMTDHIYIYDMKRIILSNELPLVNKWNQVEISCESIEEEIYFGVHVYNLQSNLENIQVMDPRRYIIVANLLQKIQEEEDWKDVEEDMDWDSNSTKYVGSLDNPMYYQERDIMEKLRPYWDAEILKVDGHSYNNLIELHQIKCKNCWRIPALGQLPALRTLTIEGLENVVAIGSEFFHGNDSASLVPFPSLETLHFENMISWEKWNSIDMDAFPSLRTLRFHDCPKLIGNLPRQLVSLKTLEIERCPLLASIPNYPYLIELVIFKSPNVVLPWEDFPSRISHLKISGRQMSDLRRYIIVAKLLQKIQEEEDWKDVEEDMDWEEEDWKDVEEDMDWEEEDWKDVEEDMDWEEEDWKDVEEDMDWDSNSTKYVGSLDDPMFYQERDIMEKLRPYWDAEILKVDGHSYNNLIELHQIKCKSCWRIPALGQLPALRTLTIEGLENVVAIGSEFFHGNDSASLVPFPSLETLHFENMISWEEWNSIDMDAFPILCTLRFHDCPKLIGNLPRQLVSLKILEIERCPLLASSIPNCPYLMELIIIKSPNVVLQGEDFPSRISHLRISGRQMSEPLFENMDVHYLIVQDCPDAVPLPVIHMPHSVERLTIADCENPKFGLVSKAPLCHLQKISIYNCKFLRSLFDDMKRLLPILKELFIKGCPELEPFSITLPSSLIRLEIGECDKLLSCLTELHHLPTITQLCIYFRSMTLHCKWLRHLTSQELQILDSPNSDKIGEIMPPSLQRLHICDYGFCLKQCLEEPSSDFLIGTSPEGMNDTPFRDWEIGTSYEKEDMNDTTLQGLFSHLFRKSSSQYYQGRVKKSLTKKKLVYAFPELMQMLDLEPNLDL